MSEEEHAKYYWHPAHLPLKYEYPVYIPSDPTDQLGQLEIQEESLKIEKDREISDHNGLQADLNEGQSDDAGNVVEDLPDEGHLGHEITSPPFENDGNIALEDDNLFSAENNDGFSAAISQADAQPVKNEHAGEPNADDLTRQIISPLVENNDNTALENDNPFSTENNDGFLAAISRNNAQPFQNEHAGEHNEDDLSHQISSPPENENPFSTESNDDFLTAISQNNLQPVQNEHAEEPDTENSNQQISSPPENNPDNHNPFSTEHDDEFLATISQNNLQPVQNEHAEEPDTENSNQQISSPPENNPDSHNPFSTEHDDGFLATISQNNPQQEQPPKEQHILGNKNDLFATSKHEKTNESSFFDNLGAPQLNQLTTAPPVNTSTTPLDSLLDDEDDLLEEDLQPPQPQTDFSFLQDDDLLDDQDLAATPTQPSASSVAPTVQHAYRPTPAVASSTSSFWQPVSQINPSAALASAQQSAATIKVDRKGTNAYDFPMDVLETERKIEASLHARVQSSQPSPIPPVLSSPPAHPPPPPSTLPSRSDIYHQPPSQPYSPNTTHPILPAGAPLPPVAPAKLPQAFSPTNPAPPPPQSGAPPPILNYPRSSSAAGRAPTPSRYSPANISSSPSPYAPQHPGSKPIQPRSNAAPLSPPLASPYTPSVPAAQGGAGARPQRYGPPLTPSAPANPPPPSEYSTPGNYHLPQQQAQPPRTGYQHQVTSYPVASQSVPVSPALNNAAGIRPPPLSATFSSTKPPFSPPQARRTPTSVKPPVVPPSRTSDSPVSNAHHPALPRRHMLLCWGCNGRIVTVSQPEISFGTSTSGEITVRKTRDVVSLPDPLTKFPGPLFAPGTKKINKQKSKDVEKWLSTSIELLETQVFNQVANQQLATQDLIALYKVLRLFLVHDFNLPAASDDVAKNLNDIFHPVSSQTVDESNSFQTSADLYVKQHKKDPSVSTTALTAGGTSMSISDVETIEGFLAKGDKAAAVYYALDKQLYSHALMIGSISGPDVWQTAVKEFIGTELTSLGPNAESLAGVYRVFAGYGSRAFDHLDFLTNWSPSGHSRQWQTALTSILCNRTPNDKEAILALGQKFAAEGAIFAAHICFLFAYPLIQCCGVAAPSQPNPPFQIVGSSDRVSTNLEAICLTETYEYITTLSSPAHALPFNHTLIFKFYHGLALADYGYVTEASKYLENVLSLLKTSSGKFPGADYLSLKVRERLQLLSENPSLEQLSANWLSRKIARPKLDKMWTQLDKSFTKFVAGDEAGNENDASTTNSGGGQRRDTRPGNKEHGQDIRFGKIAAESEAVGITRVPSSVVISKSSSTLNLQDGYPLPASPGPGSRPPQHPYPTRPVANGGSRSRSYAPSSEVTSRPSSAQLRYSYASSVTDVPSLAGGNGEMLIPPSIETNGAPNPPLRHAQSARGMAGRYQASARRVVSGNSAVQSGDGYPLPPAGAADVGASSYSRQQRDVDDDIYYSEPQSAANISAPLPATFSLHAGSSVASDNGAAPNEEAQETDVVDVEPEQESYGYAPPVYEPPDYEPPTAEIEQQQEEEEEEEEEQQEDEMAATADDDSSRRYEPQPVQETDIPAATETAAAEPIEKEKDQKSQDEKLESPKKGRWFSWLHRNNADQALQDQQPKAIRAKLGEESKFYYDKDLKRWVNKSAKLDNEGPSVLPPPPKSTGKRPPPGVGSPPPGPPAVKQPSQAPSSASTAPQPPPPAAAAAPPPPHSATTKSTANLDDLLAAPPPPTTGHKRSARKNARNRYVDIMENK